MRLQRPRNGLLKALGGQTTRVLNTNPRPEITVRQKEKGRLGQGGASHLCSAAPGRGSSLGREGWGTSFQSLAWTLRRPQVGGTTAGKELLSLSWHLRTRPPAGHLILASLGQEGLWPQQPPTPKRSMFSKTRLQWGQRLGQKRDPGQSPPPASVFSSAEHRSHGA